MHDGEPAGAEAAAICDALLLRGVIVQPTGDHKNVLKIKPPMVITRESAEFFLEELDAVLRTGRAPRPSAAARASAIRRS
jgi:4-aminobutyrate aminotransferase-like enzyme